MNVLVIQLKKEKKIMKKFMEVIYLISGLNQSKEEKEDFICQILLIEAHVLKK